MDREKRGGWVYMMTNRYRGTLYTGVTSSLAHRFTQHREGKGSDFCKREGLTWLVYAERLDTIDLAIAHEKRVKHWHRDWKIALVEKANPDWDDLFDLLAGPKRRKEAGPRVKPGVTSKEVGPIQVTLGFTQGPAVLLALPRSPHRRSRNEG